MLYYTLQTRSGQWYQNKYKTPILVNPCVNRVKILSTGKSIIISAIKHFHLIIKL